MSRGHDMAQRLCEAQGDVTLLCSGFIPKPMDYQSPISFYLIIREEQ